MTRLLLWLKEKAALVRMLDDAHRALHQAHETNKALAITGNCCGRAEHVRLAHRGEIAEARIEGRLAEWLPPLPLGLSEPRTGGDGS